ncbi:MAG: heat-inducible transcriptional repressor HrcA [Actinomycetota bacterium]|jgi:heat-inducible transcriptional repressor|nr:heat-inducible transcriptional repressor HrcA [Actinomycetota bacterium]
MPTPPPSNRPDPQSLRDEPDLDGRKAAILNAVVAEYIETAQPVGSGHVTGAPGIDVSSATVRSEMATLEREGFLVQPHTSAGRIPTDKGYRFFVDHMASPGTLGEAQRQEVRQFFAQVHGEVEELLARTSGLLTNLTDYATVVVGPGHESSSIRSVQLVGLAPTVVLVLVVLSDGAVDKRTVEVAEDVSETALAAASAHLTAGLVGHVLGSQGASLLPTGDESVDALVRIGAGVVAELGQTPEADHVFVGGSSRVASAFDAVDTVRSVLAILEQQLVVVELIEEVLDSGLTVAIGVEHGFEPLASCALVVSPLTVDGEPAGTIGVLGPTRMNYSRALAAVQVVGEQLSDRLSRTAGGGVRAGDGGLRREGER